MQDKWRLNNHLTLSLGARYDLEIIPIPETDDPLVTTYPVDKNNFQPRVGLTYDLGGGTSVVRGGYGRFYDKTHFELIGGLYTATPFTIVVHLHLAGRRARIRGHATASSRPIRSSSNGPTINTRCLNQQFPGGQLLRNTGVSWDNEDRQVPYTDQLTAGYERQLAGNMAISADYVHAMSRDC